MPHLKCDIPSGSTQFVHSFYSLLSDAKIKSKIMIILDFLQSKLKDKLFQGNVTYYKATSDQVPYLGGVL